MRMAPLSKAAGLALALWLTSTVSAVANCISSPDLAPAARITSSEAAAGPTRRDANGRVVAPVTINGQGPFRFIVDTGANRSVLSTALAQSLALTPTGMGDVHSIDGVQSAPLVDVASLNYGLVPLGRAALPVLGNAMMGGEQGILGVDGMQGKRLRLDFEHRCIEIIPSRTAPMLRGWAQIRGTLRFGHLVVVPARVENVHVNVLIDTGSDISLANTAFRVALERGHLARTPSQIERAYTAGRPVLLGNAVVVPELRLSTVTISDTTLYIGDFHIFALWELLQEPTLLIGMDVLSHAHALAIDYERGMVYFRLPPTRGGWEARATS